MRCGDAKTALGTPARQRRCQRFDSCDEVTGIGFETESPCDPATEGRLSHPAPNAKAAGQLPPNAAHRMRLLHSVPPATAHGVRQRAPLTSARMSYHQPRSGYVAGFAPDAVNRSARRAAVPFRAGALLLFEFPTIDIYTRGVTCPEPQRTSAVHRPFPRPPLTSR